MDNNLRTSTINRKTEETSISIKLNLDGTGKYNIETDEDLFRVEENFIVDEEEYEDRKRNPNQLLFKNKENLLENRESYDKEYKFEIGDEIFHEKYGYGTIKYIVDNKYEITFDKLSETRIVLENFIKRA